mmetsp:Transcript_85599/g.256410  ORF Transcript_85599/g.256410 Transcript_85599/m.256410 type:complete len:123 (+) Transcript_85599:1008-1376(+)
MTDVEIAIVEMLLRPPPSATDFDAPLQAYVKDMVDCCNFRSRFARKGSDDSVVRWLDIGFAHSTNPATMVLDMNHPCFTSCFQGCPQCGASPTFGTNTDDLASTSFRLIFVGTPSKTASARA